jgi:hypothetical protein
MKTTREQKHLMIMCYTSIAGAVYFTALWSIHELGINAVFIGVLIEMITIPMMLLTVLLVPLYVIKHEHATGSMRGYYWVGLLLSLGVLSFLVVSFLG